MELVTSVNNRQNFTHHKLSNYEGAKYLRIAGIRIRLLSRSSLDLDVRGRLEVVVLVVSYIFWQAEVRVKRPNS